MFGKLRGGGKLKALIAASMREMEEKTDAASAAWGLAAAERWDADYPAGTLTFTFPDRRVSAPLQVIGTYNVDQETWLWSWANATMEDGLTEHAELLREFGKREGYSRLVTPKLSCSEYECWEFLALARHVAGAEGVYRGPSNDLRVFMTFGPVTVHPLI